MKLMKKIIKGVKFRRRRESVTNYKRRLGLVKGGIDRIVVRKSNRRIIGQIVRYDPKGDKVLKHADSNELSKFNWPSRSNRSSAYLTGLLLAKKAGKEASKDLVLDIGLSSPVANSLSFVFAKGCIDGGLKLRGTLEIKEGIYNYSDTKYAAELKSKNAERYQKQYSAYIKKNTHPEVLGKLFSETKERIMKG